MYIYNMYMDGLCKSGLADWHQHSFYFLRCTPTSSILTMSRSYVVMFRYVYIYTHEYQDALPERALPLGFRRFL